MAGRYEISDNGWALIEDIVSPPKTMGRPRRDDRQVLNGIFWIFARAPSGATFPSVMVPGPRCITDSASGVMMAPSTPC